ncbi:MAG: FtsX-like permease family protein [Bacteroidaceae bacterium]|nr:FtsX-like permease family protein [Bacteroidaceae bacterium]
MFPLYIARRYLFSRKSHHTINIISAISVVGVILATTALVITLSVFNGFSDLVASLFTAFDPELKVSLSEGKTIAASDSALLRLRSHPDIATYTEVLEDQALIVGTNHQYAVTIKGVDDSFADQAELSSLLYGDGEFTLHADVLEYGVLGIRLASSLGLGTRYEGGLPIYAPRRGERVNMANPMQSFNRDELYSPGVVFAVNQTKYDAHYILTSIQFARKLFDKPNRVSGIELRLRDGASLRRAQSDIQSQLGPRFKVENRYEQQADVFRIMQVEKFIAYIFLTFILLVASFNIIGSLSMLMIEKKENVATLRALGASDSQVANIFLAEGWLISGLGAILGIIIGLLACWGQQTFGWVKMGQSSGSFLIEAYPVSIHASDIILIFATVLAVSIVAVWWPVRRMTRNLLA